MDKETYVVWVIIGYELEAPDGSFMRSVQIEVIAETEEDALEKAKKLITKPNYYVKMIVEKHAES